MKEILCPDVTKNNLNSSARSFEGRNGGRVRRGVYIYVHIMPKCSRLVMQEQEEEEQENEDEQESRRHYGACKSV